MIENFLLKIDHISGKKWELLKNWAKIMAQKASTHAFKAEV